MKTPLKVTRSPCGVEPSSPAFRWFTNFLVKDSGSDWDLYPGRESILTQHPLSKAAEGLAAKLAPKSVGPYTVAKFTSPNLVRLRRPGDRRRRIANISQLKPYYAVDTPDTIDDGITGACNPAR